MPRIRFQASSARRGACLFAAWLALGGGSAWAQTVLPAPDPFAPQLEADPRNPPRLQPSPRLRRGASDRPARFAPIPPGAGLTGFDSSNARKKLKPKRPAKTQAKAPALAPVESVLTAPPPVAPASPYQFPVPPLGASAPIRGPITDSNSALPPMPGAPPVDIGPIRKPPKKRNAHPGDPEDPFAPLGIRAGAFDFFPAIELIGGYNSNPSGTPGGAAAWLYTISPELLVNSNWSRHSLKAELRGSYTGYQPDATPTLSRPYFNGKVDGRIDVTHNTHIDLETRALMSTDNPGSPNLQAGLAKLPVFTTVGAFAGLTHRFNRVELAGKVDAERTRYQASVLTDGSTVSNDDRNYNQFTGTLRGSYQLTPGVKPFVEASLDTRRHDIELDSSGFARNSNGTTVKAGSTLELTRVLTGEVALGYTRRNYQDARLEAVAGLIGDASLIWTASALTTVKFTGTSSTGESTVPDVSGVLNRSVGLQVDHAFRRWLIGSVKLGAGLDNYVGMDRTDRHFSAGLGMTYKIGRTVQVKGEFRQDWLRSNVAGNDYTASTFLLGLRFQR